MKPGLLTWEMGGDAIARQIVTHARLAHPREACGLVVRTGEGLLYWPAPNLAMNGAEFVLDPQAWMAAEEVGEVVAVVHSHPHGDAQASPHDVAACRASGVPWWIVAPAGHDAPDWLEIDPSGLPAASSGLQEPAR